MSARRRRVALFVLPALALFTLGAGPHPDEAPETLVERLVDALERAGWGEVEAYAEAFELTSVRHQALTGPLPRFIGVMNRVYTPLLAPHLGLDFVPMHIDGDLAEQRVTVRLEDGSAYDYVFRLRRAVNPGCRTCWYVDGIYEVEPTSPHGLPGGQLV